MNWKNTSTTLRSVTLLARKVAPASREQIARHLFFRHLIVCVAAFTQLLNWQLTAHAATFTNDATITETNTAFDDQDIIVSGATVTIDGPHSFSSLLLTNGAVLTHSSCTTTATHRLDLAISNAIAVSGNSRIDVSYRGYVLGQTSGNTTNGAATGHAGGSYGGLGAAYNGTPNAVYGDYADPDDWGSGGAGIADNGYGGGLARIVVGALALDGQLLADGINNGSGGGIYVAVNTLRGAGLIRAMGGLGPYAGGAGGGGGRVAVYAADMAGFDLSRITAPGGHTANSDGGAGTVYVAQGLPHAHVRSFQPKGLNGGLVGNELPTITNRTGYFSNVFDRFTLTFNKPINTNSYDASKLLINGPNGPITAGGFIEISNRTYQIPLGQQTANGVYQFTLLPSLLDTEGFQLDQNANGIPGETNDAYSFTLIMDRVGPRVTQHSPSGGVPLGIASMEIEFNEAIDPTTFSTTDVLIITPTGQTNAITAVQTLNSNRFRITFPPLAAPGLHRLRVGPNIQDLAGNALDQDRDGIAGESLDDVYDVCFYVHEAAGSGLVSWWRAEGNTLDSIGTNHGVLNSGVAFAPGRIGQAFNFDGQNGSVNIPDGPSVRLGSEFTVDFWFSPARFITTADTMAHTFLSKGSDDSIGTANRDGRIEVRGPSPRIQSAASTWQANVWHHVALTYVAGVYRLFVDGAEQASTTNLHAILDNPNPIQLGVSPQLAAPFQGLLDEVRLHDRALTAGEIAFHFASDDSSGPFGITLLTGLSPLGGNGGFFNTPITNLILSFKVPISTAAFNATNITVDGPLGSLHAISISEICDRTYQFTFPPLTEDGAYHFTLLPTLLGTNGLPLDLNLNGTNGDAGDTLTFTLTLDTRAPHVAQHAPAGDVAGTITDVDVWFSERMDASTISASDFQLLNPTNGDLAVTGVEEVGLNRFRISFPPQTATGQYTLLIGTNLTDLAGNAPASASEVTFNLVVVDLGLTNVVVSTNQLIAGDPVTISWQGINRSGAPLVGNWTDGVYLSHDAQWDINDIRLATVPHNGGLTNSEVYSASASVYVSGLLPGSYYILVRADIQNQEGSGKPANLALAGPMPLNVRALASGGSFSGTLTSDARFQYFAINVAAGDSLRLGLAGQTGVNHIYVGLGSIPTQLNYDFSGATPEPNQAILLTGAPGGGTYYVLVYGEQVSGANPYTLTAGTAAFYLTAITPNQIVGGESPRFWVSELMLTQPAATLSGAGFDQQTTVEFVDSTGASHQPSRTEFVDSTAIRLSLAPGVLPAGDYSVRVTKGSVMRVLTSGFSVVTGGEAKLEAHLVVPNHMDAAGGQTLYVEYANTGTRAMPAPLLKVTTYTNATIVTYKLNPAAFPATGGLGGGGGSGGGGGGANVIPSYLFRVGVPLNSVQAMALGSGSTPGWLQPGESGRVPVYFGGEAHAVPHSQLQFSLGSVTADDTTIQECPSPAPGVPGNVIFPRTGIRAPSVFPYTTNGVLCPERLFTVPWDQLESDSRPETADTNGWHAVWQNVITNVGALWPDYVIAMGNNMNYLARIGQTTNDPAQLFNFEVLQASGALNPVRTLASAVGASAPGSGFPLVFRRVYGQPILSRYKLGPLGRGWNHNWDISVQGLERFNGAVVHGPGGVDRFFGRFANGVYVGTGGDAAQLTVTSNLFRLTESDGTVWQFGGHGLKNLLDYVQDPNGNRITCDYSGTQLTALAHSSGRQLLLDYDAHGRLWHLTDPLGPGAADDRVTTFEYDTSGEHLQRVTAPGNRITTYGYDLSAQPQRFHALTNVIHPDLTQDMFAYDARGRLMQSSKTCCGGGQQVNYSYDFVGAVVVTDATSRTTQLLYGLGGQLAQVRDGEGRVVNFGYDAGSQLTQLLGPGGERYRYAYDGLGNLTGIEDPLRHTNSFAYEPNFNRLGNVTDARGNPLGYNYDSRGNLTAITYADSTHELFAYDESGNLITSTNRRGAVINYRYNSFGQLTNKYYLNETGRVDYFYAYDIASNLTNASYFDSQLLSQQTISLAYEPLTDRLKRIDYPGGKWFEFEYDSAGHRTKRTDQDGSIDGYVYDAAGRLKLMTNGLGQLIVNYDYDDAGRLLRKTLGNGVYTTNFYNNAGQILQLINRKPDSSLLSGYTYTYDASGRRDSMSIARGYTLPGTNSPPPSDSQVYGYDPLGQLESVTYSGGRVVKYIYDAVGNRTEVQDNGASTSYNPNTLNEYSNVGGDPHYYDADGNLTNKTEAGLATTYAYDPENRLVGVTTPTDIWNYAYDAFGNRVAATHNGQTTRYLIDPTGLGNVAAEYDGSGNLIARYEHGFGLLTRADAVNSPAYYTFSAIGHTSEVVDGAGGVADSYSYDPFGLSLAKTETIANPFEFVGEFGVMNEGNGLELMRRRSFAPQQARFIQPDPIGIAGGLNPYAYTGNSPINFVDLTGLDRSEDTWNQTRSGSVPAWVDLDPAWRNYARGYDGYLDKLHYDWVRNELHQQIWDESANVAGHLTITAAAILLEFPWLDLLGAPSMISEFRENYDMIRAFWPWRWLWQVSLPVPYPLFLNGLGWSEILVNGDPNDKFGPSGYGESSFVQFGGMLAYEVLFENEPEATEPTHQIIVTDVLDHDLDLSTFELTEISFADQFISVPPGLNHYEDSAPFMAGTNEILAEVSAVLDLPSRTLRLTLTAIDPATGWWPEDPLIGLLYPEDGTGRGQGHISYIVKPLPGTPTGTVITNRATIVFDYNDPIDTPLVSNTIDSHEPTSNVNPLPPTSPRTFYVSWVAQDDPGGSGLAGVDVVVTVDGTNSQPWVLGTLATEAWFTGVPGHSYGFFTVARDNVGNVEAEPLVADTSTSVPTNAPILQSLTNISIRAGSALVITNVVQQGTPVGYWVFSLDAGAPDGASVNPTNGVFSWTPSCQQASTTNVITVRVTDSGWTNMTDTASFTVTVGECVQPTLGRQILLAGDNGRVPINLFTSVELTNLAMTLVSPAGRLVSFNIQPIVAEICATSVTPLSNGLCRLNLLTCPNQSLIGTQQVAWLNFTAAANQSSSFVRMEFADLSGNEADGTPVANFAPQAGRVVVVGEEPLLEMVSGTNGQPVLVLYGKPTTGFSVEWRTNLSVGAWQPILTNLTVPTNLFLQFAPPPGSGPMNFYRGKRAGLALAEKVLSLASVDGTNVFLRFSGVAGRTYRVQFSPTVSPPSWQTIGTSTAGLDGLFQYTDTNGWGQMQRYYRLIWP